MADGNFIQLNDLSMYYEEAGSGQALILLHGSMGSGAVWQLYLPVFSPYGRVVVPDLRNHGRTTLTPDFNPAQAAEQNVADVIGLLDALGIAQATLCGWSFGGNLALQVAQHNPERVRALVVGGVTLQMTDAARATLHAGSVQPLPVRSGLPWLGFVLYRMHQLEKRHNAIHFRRLQTLNSSLCRRDILSFVELDASVQGWNNHVRFRGS